MDVLDAVVTDGARGSRRGRAVVAGLGVVAVLAIATALLVALLGGTARAQTTDPGPQPYGGQLEKVDETDRVTSEQVLEVGMLALGTLNGVAFVVAMVASRLRGPSTAQTRRALIARTGAGVVSESRRARRQRLQGRGTGPVPSPAAPSPGAPMAAAGDGPAGGPSAQAPRTPPPGAVPVQGGPAPREGLVPAGRAPHGPSGPAQGRPAPVSPPSGVPAPVHPPARR